MFASKSVFPWGNLSLKYRNFRRKNIKSIKMYAAVHCRSRQPSSPSPLSLVSSVRQGFGHFLWREARQCEILGESWAAPSMAGPCQSEERVHCVWAHWHQHAAAAGRQDWTYCFVLFGRFRSQTDSRSVLCMMCIYLDFGSLACDLCYLPIPRSHHYLYAF